MRVTVSPKFVVKSGPGCTGVGGRSCLPSGLLSVYTVFSTWKLLEVSNTYPHLHRPFVLLSMMVTSGTISVKTPQAPRLLEHPVCTSPDHCPPHGSWGLYSRQPHTRNSFSQLQDAELTVVPGASQMLNKCFLKDSSGSLAHPDPCSCLEARICKTQGTFQIVFSSWWVIFRQRG